MTWGRFVQRGIRISAVGGLALVVAAGALAGCSSDDDTKAAEATTTTTQPVGRWTKAPAPVPGPRLETTELTGGEGVRLLIGTETPDLAKAGYEEHEYAVSGKATSYTAADGKLPTDGRYDLIETDRADFTTRVVVRRPKDPKDFNGTVVVEWLNVSSGADTAPDYTYLADELLREGYGWAGVSAQQIGVEGGPVAVPTPLDEQSGAGKGLKTLDPARYGSLSHPGDAFAYDIYTQVARQMLATGNGAPMGDLDVRRLLAVGESQSAFMLTTYANGVQPQTHLFDGFLIHSRGGSAAPLGEVGKGIDIATSLGGEPTIVRTDVEVPTMIVQTETDVLGLLDYYPARQDDTERIRLWEIAGTAHADHDQVGDAEQLLGCPDPVNRGQQGYVLRAALRDLDRWAKEPKAPPKAARLDVDTSGAKPTYEVDENGNVTGGIRTPAVDAPTQLLSGAAAPDASIVCALFGRTEPLPAERIAALYDDRAAYDAAYEKATDSAIEAGFVLPEDEKAILAETETRAPSSLR